MKLGNNKGSWKMVDLSNPAVRALFNDMVRTVDNAFYMGFSTKGENTWVTLVREPTQQDIDACLNHQQRTVLKRRSAIIDHMCKKEVLTTLGEKPLHIFRNPPTREEMGFNEFMKDGDGIGRITSAVLVRRADGVRMIEGTVKLMHDGHLWVNRTNQITPLLFTAPTTDDLDALRFENIRQVVGYYVTPAQSPLDDSILSIMDQDKIEQLLLAGGYPPAVA